MKNQQNNTKPRLKVTMYEKAFETFSDMIFEFKNLHPEFLNIFTYADTDTSTDAANDVCEYFKTNMPNITNRTNLPMAISVSANKVSLKTNRFFSFEWSFKYDKEGNVTNLSAIITTFTKERNSDELNNMIASIQGSGWRVKENIRNRS